MKSVRERVLLVVEHLQIGNDLADALEILGYQVTDILTSSGPLLESRSTLEADVVVLDLQVQDEGDLVGAGQLIHERWNRPVVYLTDDVQQANWVNRAGRGALSVMWPFHPDELDAAIQESLNPESIAAGPVPSYIGGAKQ